MNQRDMGDDDEKPDAKEGRHFEFDCPECNAHNPYDDGFAVGDEVICYYCGVEYHVAQGEGRIKFKPT